MYHCTDEKHWTNYDVYLVCTDESLSIWNRRVITPCARCRIMRWSMIAAIVYWWIVASSFLLLQKSNLDTTAFSQVPSVRLYRVQFWNLLSSLKRLCPQIWSYVWLSFFQKLNWSHYQRATWWYVCSYSYASGSQVRVTSDWQMCQDPNSSQQRLNSSFLQATSTSCIKRISEKMQMIFCAESRAIMIDLWNRACRHCVPLKISSDQSKLFILLMLLLQLLLFPFSHACFLSCNHRVAKTVKKNIFRRECKIHLR